jgi:hypothetical protein
MRVLEPRKQGGTSRIRVAAPNRLSDEIGDSRFQWKGYDTEG